MNNLISQTLELRGDYLYMFIFLEVKYYLFRSCFAELQLENLKQKANGSNLL